MIRALSQKKDGGVLVVLGLSEGNVQRLKKGEPVHVTGESWGAGGAVFGMPANVDIAIFYGTTEQAMADELRQYGMLPSKAIPGADGEEATA